MQRVTFAFYSLFSREWLLEFLERDGLGVLLESLNWLGDQKVQSVADTVMQMQCMSCLKAVINFRPGLQYIVQRNEYTRKLAAGNVAGTVYSVLTAAVFHSEVCLNDRLRLSKASSQQSAIWCFHLQFPLSSLFLKVIQ